MKSAIKVMCQPTKSKQLGAIRAALNAIDYALDVIEVNDPYGDLVENFCTLESKTKRITTEVRETINSLEHRKVV